MINTQVSREREVPESAGPLRMTVKREARATGFVDGAWWPYSRDLAAELPALITALGGASVDGARMLRVERVSYNLGTWGPTDREIVVDGVVVRLGGFRSQHADTVDLIGHNERLTVLVVPPETAPESGTRALATAAEAGNADLIEHLLRCDPGPLTVPAVRVEPGEDEHRWDCEGGHFQARG